MIQGSEQWRAERCGKVTASCFADVLATIKTGEAATRRNYRTRLVIERLTGQPQETYSNGAMDWGTATEPRARAAFELATGLDVQEVGFVPKDDWIGCSPDGLIGTDAGLEIKCPTSSTHLDTLIAQKMPAEHVAQVQGSLWIAGRQRWHFVSYDPRFPADLRLFHTVIERDDIYISKLALAVELFLSEVAETVQRLQNLKAAA